MDGGSVGVVLKKNNLQAACGMLKTDTNYLSCASTLGEGGESTDTSAAFNVKRIHN